MCEKNYSSCCDNKYYNQHPPNNFHVVDWKILFNILSNYITDLNYLNFLSTTTYQEKYSIDVNNINKIILLSNGLVAAVSKTDYSIILYNNTNSTPIIILKGHQKSVNGLTQLKSGLLASSSSDTTIKLWDLSLENYTISLNAENYVFVALELSDGRLAAGLFNGTIQLWNLTTYKIDLTFNYHITIVYNMIQLSDGRVASADVGGIINIWSPTGVTKVSLIGNVNSVLILVELNNGLLAAGTGNNTIQIWNITSNTLVYTLTGHSGSVTTLIQLKNGLLVSGSMDSTIKLWNANTGEMLVTLKDHSSNVHSVLENNEHYLISCSADDTIKTWSKFYLLKFSFGSFNFSFNF